MKCTAEKEKKNGLHMLLRQSQRLFAFIGGQKTISFKIKITNGWLIISEQKLLESSQETLKKRKPFNERENEMFANVNVHS